MKKASLDFDTHSGVKPQLISVATMLGASSAFMVSHNYVLLSLHYYVPPGQATATPTLLNQYDEPACVRSCLLSFSWVEAFNLTSQRLGQHHAFCTWKCMLDGWAID